MVNTLQHQFIKKKRNCFLYLVYGFKYTFDLISHSFFPRILKYKKIHSSRNKVLFLCTRFLSFYNTLFENFKSHKLQENTYLKLAYGVKKEAKVKFPFQDFCHHTKGSLII